MINRVLIRTKAVQILYSYLLTRSEFKIEPAPETTSRDRRYAYTVYVNTLLLLLELSGYSAHSGSLSSPLPEANANKYLKGNRLMRALAADDAMRGIILRGNAGIEAWEPALADLYDAIIKSDVYKSYMRVRTRGVEDDMKLWTALIPTVIETSGLLKELARQNPEFTNRGYDNGIKMALNTLRDFSDNRMLLEDARNSLERSLDKAYELYHSLLRLCIDITNVEAEHIEEGRNRVGATPEELNPNTRFIDNAFVKALSENPSFNAYLEKHSDANWANEPMLLRGLLNSIKQTDAYREYMEKRETTFAEDCELWRALMRSVIVPSDDLAEVLENNSVYWNDDLEIMSTFAAKTIKQMANAGPEAQVETLPKFKDEEDAAFGAQLFSLSVEHREEYRELIDRFINREQWDSERLAFMDIVIMIAAIAELLNFPAIPIPVTLNEYIEIANSYSTPKSGQFINGILYSVIKCLQEEGKLLKR